MVGLDLRLRIPQKLAKKLEEEKNEYHYKNHQELILYIIREHILLRNKGGKRR